MRETVLEALLRRDRAVVVVALVGAGLLAWGYTLLGAGLQMPALTPVPWTPAYAVLILLMWWIMMVAMMLPSAAPMVLLFAAVNRRSRAQGAPYAPMALFVAGYLLAWGGFSLIAVATQRGLERAALLSPMMETTSVALGGALLVGAGVYQLTPLKYACLRHCRSPMSFVMHHWRPGRAGALRMGLEHGLFCLGCCWVLMALLYYGGIMNPYWIAGLALYVLLEKTIPLGHGLGRASGALLILWGGAVLALGL